MLRFRSLTGLAFAVLFLGCHPRDEAARVPLAAPPPGRGSTASAGPSPPASAARPAKRVIVFVWDGLRPDSIDETDTPRLAEIAARGTVFTDHHATYPTFTMINGATFATGSLVASTGFYGNWLWQPLVPKKSPSGVPLVSGESGAVRYEQPFFTEQRGERDGAQSKSVRTEKVAAGEGTHGVEGEV